MNFNLPKSEVKCLLEYLEWSRTYNDSRICASINNLYLRLKTQTHTNDVKNKEVGKDG